MRSAAVTAMLPDQGYNSEQQHKFCRLSVVRNAMNETKSWYYFADPLLRCGTFDYRTDRESRGDNPHILTATAAALISLQESNQMCCLHGTGVVMPDESESTIQQFFRSKSSLRQDYKPETVSHITFVKVAEKNIAKFDVVMEDSDADNETTIAEWKPCTIPSSTSNENHTSIVCLDSDDNTKIRFNKSGHCIIIGRVAGCLKKEHAQRDHRPTIHLDVCNSFGTPLQTKQEVVSFYSSSRHNKRMDI
jgi:hypothetical protein